jgi:hypothetical protein
MVKAKEEIWILVLYYCSEVGTWKREKAMNSVRVTKILDLKNKINVK